MKLEELHDMDPFEFEIFVAQVFSALNYNVLVTSKTSDGGIDVIADQYDPYLKKWTRTVIQVKRYKSTIGIDKIRELNGVLDVHNALFGCLITLSDFKLGVKEKTFKDFPQISLKNKSEFKELLNDAGMLDAEENIISTTDPNLEKNRLFSILNILREIQPQGITNIEIINILQSEFSVTVPEERVKQDIKSLLESGKIISIENKLYYRPKTSEIQIALSNFPEVLDTIDYFINFKIICRLLEDYYSINRKIWDIYLRKDVEKLIDNLVKEKRLNLIDNQLYATQLAVEKFKNSNLDVDQIKINVDKILGYSEDTKDILIKDSTFYPDEGIAKVLSGTDEGSKKLMPFLKIFLARCGHCDGLLVWTMEGINLYVTSQGIEHKFKNANSVNEKLEKEIKRLSLSKLFTERLGDSFEKHFNDLKESKFNVDGVFSDIRVDLEIDKDFTLKVLRDKIIEISEKYQSFINEVYSPIEGYGRPINIYPMEIEEEMEISFERLEVESEESEETELESEESEKGQEGT